MKFIFLFGVLGTAALATGQISLNETTSKLKEDGLSPIYDSQLRADLQVMTTLIFLLAILGTSLGILYYVMLKIHEKINDMLRNPFSVKYAEYHVA